MTTKAVSLKAKQAYYARVRRLNYEASLRLEGFPADPGASTPVIAMKIKTKGTADVSQSTITTKTRPEDAI